MQFIFSWSCPYPVLGLAGWHHWVKSHRPHFNWISFLWAPERAWKGIHVPSPLLSIQFAYLLYNTNFIFGRDCICIPHQVGKPLIRKTKDGRIFPWIVENDDPLCTLQDVFQKVKPSIGFNIELKFDDQILYQEEKLTHVVQVTLKVGCGLRPKQTCVFT